MAKTLDHLFIVSHELRTPLTVMKEGLSQIFSGMHGDVNTGQKKILSSSLNNIDRMGRLVNDILDVSKFEAGLSGLNMELTDVVELANDAVYSFESYACSRGLKIELRTAAKKIDVLIDKDKIMQVFVNLIGNAVKFTKKGFIEVSIQDNADGFECSVSDTGIGISQENLRRLFKKFSQFEKPVNSGDPSTGLGLAICKLIIAKHNGTIRAKSPSGIKVSSEWPGTTFTFTIPRLSKEISNTLKISE